VVHACDPRYLDLNPGKVSRKSYLKRKLKAKRTGGIAQVVEP
jgi:hypothetical protein